MLNITPGVETPGLVDVLMLPIEGNVDPLNMLSTVTVFQFSRMEFMTSMLVFSVFFSMIVKLTSIALKS